MLFDILFDLICQDLFELIRGEEPKASHRAELKAAFLAGGLLYSLKWWLDSRSDITESEFTENLAKIIGDGISDNPKNKRRPLYSRSPAQISPDLCLL